MDQPGQPHSYHLTISLILLVLTVYPYLFNSAGYKVAAYSADDLYLRHNFIDQFDILQSDDIILSRPISKRSIREEQLLHDQQNTNTTHDEPISIDEVPGRPSRGPIRRVQFSSLGRRYNLIFDQVSHLLTDDFTITALDANGVATKVPFDRNDLQVLEGSIEGENGSRAVASFSKQNRLMTAQMSAGNETIVVEPTYLHKDLLQQSFNSKVPESSSHLNETTKINHTNSSKPKIYDNTMIVYRLRDHKEFQTDVNGNDTILNFGKFCGALQLNQSIQSKPNVNDSTTFQEFSNIFKIYTRPGSKRTKRDIEFPYEQSKDKTRCSLHLVADYLFYKHIGNGEMQTTTNYLLALINRVNKIYLPTIWEVGDDKLDTFSNIGFTVQGVTIHQEFTKLSSDDIHYNMESDRVWSAREFLDNFSRNSPPKHYCLAHLLTYRKFDSPVLGLAYVASTQFGKIGGICSPTQQRGGAIYRHNTGMSSARGIHGETLITRQADLLVAHELGHNLGAEHDSDECRPSPSKNGSYLMHPFSVIGLERNNGYLSKCSRQAIGRVVRRKAPHCFVSVVDNICGNGVREGDEQCDGGDLVHGNRDPCCDSSCRLVPGAQCSDRDSWCCSKCRIVPAGRFCRPAEEFNCKQASFCDGQRAECPVGPPVEDEKVCVGRGLCRGGACVPFCEARDLRSCLCNTPAEACKLCCKSSLNGTCVPYDNRAPSLPDGVLCYRGVCEKGRCEQPIQDVVERLWDVIEDINFTTLVKFLRDNIILVVLIASIPLWCVIAHYINEFDKRVKQDVVSAIIKNRRHKEPPGRSPFLPRLFVGDEMGSASSLDDHTQINESLKPLKQVHPGKYPYVPPPNTRNKFLPPPHRPVIGFQPPEPGFQLPHGEEVAIEPSGSIALNSIELPHENEAVTNGIEHSREQVRSGNGNEINPDDLNSENLYSTQV